MVDLGPAIGPVGLAPVVDMEAREDIHLITLRCKWAGIILMVWAEDLAVATTAAAVVVGLH